MISKWFVYIAVDKTNLFTGICNNLISEELLLKEESKSDTLSIKWYQEFDSKIDGLKKLNQINKMDDKDKLILMEDFNSIIILKDEDYKENYSKYPSIYNLKQTLQISEFLKHSPEIWKLDDLYIEHVSEFLAIRKNQIEYVKLWNISMDFSCNVGLVTKDIFLPIIKY